MRAGGLYFYRDLTRFTNMTYAELLTEIATLNTELSGAGPWQDNWHLALPAEMGSGVGPFDAYIQVPDVFVPTSVLDRSTGYKGRSDEIPGGPPGHLVFEVPVSQGSSPPITKESFESSDSTSSSSLGAWVVASQIPVPGSMPLGVLGPGLIGRLAGRRRLI